MKKFKIFNPKKWKKVEKTQKGIHFTSEVNKYLENILIYFLMSTPVTPDMITILTDILAFFAVYLALNNLIGWFLVIAFIVTILDGTDGKLARVKGIEGKIGKIEHSFDFLYEQAWYATIVWTIFRTTNSLYFLGMGLVFIVLDGYVRHIYNIAWLSTGKSLKENKKWRWFFKVDARRNVHVWYWIVFYVLGYFQYAIFLNLLHTAITAFIYTYISFKQKSKR